jgi:hypothetical protein
MQVKLKYIIYRIVFFFNKYVCECTAGVDVAVEPNQPLRRGCDKMVNINSSIGFSGPQPGQPFSLIAPFFDRVKSHLGSTWVQRFIT